MLLDGLLQQGEGAGEDALLLGNDFDGIKVVQWLGIRSVTVGAGERRENKEKQKIPPLPPPHQAQQRRLMGAPAPCANSFLLIDSNVGYAA